MYIPYKHNPKLGKEINLLQGSARLLCMAGRAWQDGYSNKNHMLLVTTYHVSTACTSIEHNNRDTTNEAIINV